MIEVTETARTVLRGLLSKEESRGKAVRILVDDYT
jgi:hypothetical protein